MTFLSLKPLTKACQIKQVYSLSTEQSNCIFQFQTHSHIPLKTRKHESNIEEENKTI